MIERVSKPVLMKQVYSAFLLCAFFFSGPYSFSQKIGLSYEPDTVYYVNEKPVFATIINKRAKLRTDVNYYAGRKDFNVIIYFTFKDTANFVVDTGYSVTLGLKSGDSVKLRMFENVKNAIFHKNQSQTFIMTYIDTASIGKLSREDLTSISIHCKNEKDLKLIIEKGSQETLKQNIMLMLKWLKLNEDYDKHLVSKEDLNKFANTYIYKEQKRQWK
jgi:hypothetical protein